MFNNQMQSSNPALTRQDAFNEFYGEVAGTVKADVTTLPGVVNKTALLVGVAVIAGGGGYALAEAFPSAMMLSWIITLVLSFGLYFVIAGNPRYARVLAVPYAAVEGVFLGALTATLDGWLKSADMVATGGLALQAFIITISIMLAMLGLYYTRVLQPTKLFRSVVMTLTAGIFIAYMLSMLGSFLFGAGLPFLELGSAFQGGYAPMIGLGLNVLILGVASMWLIIDFGLVEEKVNAGAPKYMEWYCGFALIVTLAWIYYEAVKLAFRLALLFGARE